MTRSETLLGTACGETAQPLGRVAWLRVSFQRRHRVDRGSAVSCGDEVEKPLILQDLPASDLEDRALRA